MAKRRQPDCPNAPPAANSCVNWDFRAPQLPGGPSSSQGTSSTSLNPTEMAYDSLRAVHPDLPVRSVRIKKRAPTRTRCRARTVRSPWNGRHRSNVREPSESLRVRYLMLVRALSDRQNGGFRKAFLTGAVRLGTQRRRERPAGRGYRTMSTTPRSDRSANTLTRAGGVATPRPHRPATSGGGVSSRPPRRWRCASAGDTPS